MTKLDPIIAVKDVIKSSNWYQSIFDCKSRHGGQEFDVLATTADDILLCLHKWGEHDHPTMKSINQNGGNGLILYFRLVNIEQVRENLRSIDHTVESEISVSPNSHKREFSFRDLDGYFITVAEYHTYKG